MHCRASSISAVVGAASHLQDRPVEMTDASREENLIECLQVDELMSRVDLFLPVETKKDGVFRTSPTAISNHVATRSMAG